jgi:hypothetical protein
MLSVIIKSQISRAESSALGIDAPFDEIEQKVMPPPVTADGLLGRIPPKEEQILAVELEKADGARHWHKRRAILTSKSLVLSRIEDEYIRDEIFLNLIEEIKVAPRNSSEDGNSKIERETSLSQIEKVMTNISRRDLSKDSDLRAEKKRNLGNPTMVNSFRNLIGHDEANSPGYIFDIITRVEELETVMTYSFRVSTQKEMDSIVQALKKARATLIKSIQKATALNRMQGRLRAFYYGYTSLGVMAVLLALNFVIDIVQAEIQPDVGSATDNAFDNLDTVFTVIFTADLLINMLSHSIWPFLCKGWNLLDALIIALSIGSLIVDTDTGNGINAFRTVRAVRAVRLLSGLVRLREIVDALISSVPRPPPPSSPIPLLPPTQRLDLPHPNYRVLATVLTPRAYDRALGRWCRCCTRCCCCCW